MEVYLEIFSNCTKQFEFVKIEHKPRREIRHVDALVFLSIILPTDEEQTLYISIQHESSIDLQVMQYRDIYINAVIKDLLEDAPERRSR